jgi:hypothetical protein
MRTLYRSLLTVIAPAEQKRPPAWQYRNHTYTNQAHEAREQLQGTSALVYCWSDDDDDDNNNNNNNTVV